jgi:hypothetical protein
MPLIDDTAMAELGERLRQLACSKKYENSLPDLSDIHV